MTRRFCCVLLLVVACAAAFAGSERQRITYRDFSGGWCSSTDIDSVQPNQLKKAYNVVIERDRSIKPRDGFYVDHTLSTSVVATNSGLIALEPNNQEFVYIDSTGKAFSTKPSDSGYGVNIYVPINANGYTAEIVKLGDWFVFGSTGDFLQYINIASTTTGSSTSVPGLATTSGIILAHNDRIFNAYKSALYETSVGSATDFAGGEAWAIGEISEGDITGLGEIGEDLYIFKTNSIYRMTGYSPAERRVELMSKNFGTTCPKSVKTADLVGLGRCLVFFSTSSKICVLTSSGITPISEAIQETLDSNTVGYSTKLIWAEYCASRQGVLFCFKDDVGASFTGCAIFLNGGVTFQSPYGPRWPFTAWGNPDVYLSSRFWGVCRNANINNADYQDANDIAVVMTNDNLIQAEKRICRPWTLKQQYLSRDNNTGTTTNFPITIQTRDEDAGDLRVWKGWRKAILSGYFKWAGSCVATYTQYNESTAISSGSVSPTGALSLQNLSIPLYNFNDRCSLNLDISSSNSFWVTEINIDFVKGPKQE